MCILLNIYSDENYNSPMMNNAVIPDKKRTTLYMYFPPDRFWNSHSKKVILFWSTNCDPPLRFHLGTFQGARVPFTHGYRYSRLK